MELLLELNLALGQCRLIGEGRGRLECLIFNSQEWPICVSYGAMAGYLIGMVASFGFVLIRGRQQHQKVD
ncbi:hypothetical protein Pint_03557 [Pistacia integerrima]|uniref:Uncharacterized protein n=1 Tax=Pistacia integerrima TaxID=434235 RepID=A0ACC0ZLY5_9ROSI|nr:hypothetical protein Pint_03557 [Pistacia integerrima]